MNKQFVREAAYRLGRLAERFVRMRPQAVTQSDVDDAVEALRLGEQMIMRLQDDYLRAAALAPQPEKAP